ncbi:thiamine phosphate synthase [Corynebacterium sp. HMSC29G08]|uniref:thiamine phosphate synthase n=1 Tax=Corynebacterium sp. HMSC29G08 TaxID=1581069 RepID=UPI0008A4EE21|nr:thiamine phosphate synthase [Corynebacterium sp. HMSC29G08]OFT84200.1 thiamine phosphate synthase [Corynebacterium sp. HMSC29G08]
MNPRSLDLRCYFVTGQGPDVVERAVEAAHGGAGIIQVRSKPISARELYALSSAIAAQLPSSSILLIDDRVDIALALQDEGVHGVHLGQDDLDPREARRLLGPDAVIGLTTGTLELVRAANELEGVIDYIGCGPFRNTPTKDSGRKPIGLDGYPALVEASRLPMVAIGDVTVDDAYALAGTGVDGVAIVRGIMHADNPRAYCERVVAEFDRGRAALA